MTTSTASGQLLAAYTDLCSDAGPLHARVAAHLGAKLHAGADVPANQAMPPLHLRMSITLDEPRVPYLESPCDLPSDARSAPWQVMCDLIEDWSALGPERRLDLARVLAKLAFWTFLTDLLGSEEPAGSSAAELALSYLGAIVRCQVDPTDAAAVARIAEIGVARATNEQLPLETRLASAVNLTVHYARRQQHDATMREWHAFAERLWSSGEARGLPAVLRSAYWRGVSFIPYRAGDHATTAEMLDRAEECAAEALEQSCDDDRVIALENFHPLLETRGRAAWDAGDLVVAESYYRKLVRLDPLDSKAHIRLAEFLRKCGRHAEARDQYRDAANLGAPCTFFARARVREYAEMECR